MVHTVEKIILFYSVFFQVPIIWFIANCGGILGLCMGFSLITIFEIGSYIMQIFCTKVSQKSELLCSKCCKKERHQSKVICSGVLSTGRVQLDLLSRSVRRT